MPQHFGDLPSRRAVLRAAGLVALTTLAACTGDDDTPSGVDTATVPGTVGPAPAASTVDVRRFGARGDGRTDDQAALELALRSLRSGQTLVLPAGHVFRHSNLLSVRTPGVRLQGPGTLEATDEARSALKIQASNVTVSGLTLAIARTTRRWTAPDQHKLYLGRHSGIRLADVVITGSAGAGVFSDGAYDFRIDRARVSDTRADGIHMTNASHQGLVTSPSIARSGDDAVAVVSYLGDAGVCSQILVDSPVVQTTTGGRGVSVVGGQDVTYRNIAITGSDAAGVYIACENGEFVTHGVERVSVTGGTIRGANTNAAIEHGAVLVYSARRGGTIADVTVSDLSISGTRASAPWQVGTQAVSAGDLVDVRFRDLALAATPTPYVTNVLSAKVDLDHVTAAGATVTK